MRAYVNTLRNRIFYMAKTKPTLEDYIFDMETRPPERSIDDTDDHMMTEQDVWQKLQKKESDLVLAAELGKALLEKNEELTKQQEKLVEEYSTKLEVCRWSLLLLFDVKTFYI